MDCISSRAARWRRRISQASRPTSVKRRSKTVRWLEWEEGVWWSVRAPMALKTPTSVFVNKYLASLICAFPVQVVDLCFQSPDFILLWGQLPLTWKVWHHLSRIPYPTRGILALISRLRAMTGCSLVQPQTDGIDLEFWVSSCLHWPTVRLLSLTGVCQSIGLSHFL